MNKVRPLLLEALREAGTYNPDKVLSCIKWKLTTTEYDILNSFLTWVHYENKSFGYANFEEVFAEWKVLK
jgi:hypothetical protein